MLRNKRGVVEPIIPMAITAAIIISQFCITVANGTFAKQVDKIKAAHHRPITVDK